MGADAVSMPDDDLTGLQITAAQMMDSDHSSIAGLGRMFARDSKEIASVVSTAIAQTHWLESVPIRRDLEKDGVRFAQLKEKPTTVYVGVIPTIMLSSAIMKIAISRQLVK